MTRQEVTDNIGLLNAFASGREILVYTDDKKWVQVSNFEINGGMYVINDCYVEFRKAEALGDIVEYYFNGRWNPKNKSDRFDNMISLRIRESFVPKQGEKILVSDIPGAGFIVREFIAMTKNGKRFICHSISEGSASSWKYAKKI